MEENQSLAETTISRHVGELEPLTTEHYMVCEVNQQQEGINMKLSTAIA